MNSDFFKILHLADSALPSGGYAFSSGLEGAFQLGILESAQSLRYYLYNSLQASLLFEIPYLIACYQNTIHNNSVEINHIYKRYEASFTSSSMRRGSLTMGRTWVRLIQNLYPSHKIQFNSMLESNPQNLPVKFGTNSNSSFETHYTLIFGVTLQMVGFDETDTLKLYLYMFLRDLISAAIRLGVVGPLAGNKLQFELYSELTILISTTQFATYQDAVKVSPQIEISQCAHAKLYSRLFQN